MLPVIFGVVGPGVGACVVCPVVLTVVVVDVEVKVAGVDAPFCSVTVAGFGLFSVVVGVAALVRCISVVGCGASGFGAAGCGDSGAFSGSVPSRSFKLVSLAGGF